ncbi:hypothetical protein pb186bvf_019446 [Paramecium bursaria]
MTRFHKLASFIVFLIVFQIWGIFYTQGYILEVIKSLPTYYLILYGSWALYTIGRELSRLKDYPEEHEYLVSQVWKAKEFYKSKGIPI